ncbi:hypothetical protein ACIQVK_50340 [Streptomyces sp. NPDC090493]|uniref:hypothetical protein n=1 Tax=Streptomyces sp. NPDC090493 TaxID=3365964 RepID=UPI0037F30ED6
MSVFLHKLADRYFMHHYTNQPEAGDFGGPEISGFRPHLTSLLESTRFGALSQFCRCS